MKCDFFANPGNQHPVRLWPYLLGLAFVMTPSVLGCVGLRSVTQNGKPEAGQDAVPKVPEPVDSLREARIAHLEASAELMAPRLHGAFPGSEVPGASKPQSLANLLQRAILNQRLKGARELAALQTALRDDAPYSAWLAALGDRLSGRPQACLQRLESLEVALGKATPRMGLQDQADLVYASEVLRALCAFDAGDRATGSAAIWRADRLAATREEHRLAQASFWRVQGQQNLESSVVAEMLAVVQRPSVAAYGFAFETMRTAGDQDALAVAIRRALAHYPGHAQIEGYLALTTSEGFDGGPSVCEAIARAYEREASLASGAFNHALCLRKQGKQKDAIRVAETALLSAMGFEPLLGLLSGLYAEVGRTEDAARVWQQALQNRSQRLSAVNQLREDSSAYKEEAVTSGMSQFLIQALAPNRSSSLLLPTSSQEGEVP